MNEIEKIPLSKEMKVLLIEVLKAGELTKDNADVLIDFIQSNGLIEHVSIVFKDFNKD